MTLRNPDGATLDDHTGEGTIRDNDDGGGGSLPTLSVGDAAVVEGDTATFRVTLSAASENVVTVSYKTKDGTAVAGSDYTAMAGTLRFEPGDTTKTIRVPTVDDDTPEETEAFTVGVERPVGGDGGRRNRDGDDQRRRRREPQPPDPVHRRRRAGARRAHGQVQGDVAQRERRAGDGGLPHGRRDGGWGLGLHDDIGNAALRAGGNDPGGCRGDAD